MYKGMLYIGSDHAGFKLKEKLKEFLANNSYEVEDIGAYEYLPDDDYPDYAIKLSKKVVETGRQGILVCGSAHGMNITANKMSGIRATICWNEKSAEFAKKHTGVNVLCLPARVIEQKEAEEAIIRWINTEFETEERHVRRVEKIKELEENRIKNGAKGYI